MLPLFPDFSLSLEQEFDSRKLQALIKGMSRPELEQLVLMLFTQKQMQENVSRGLIREMIEQDQTSISAHLKSKAA